MQLDVLQLHTETCKWFTCEQEPPVSKQVGFILMCGAVEEKFCIAGSALQIRVDSVYTEQQVGLIHVQCQQAQQEWKGEVC